MNLGERLRYFRKLNKMTQRDVGLKLGFNERTAAIRVFQYETGRRIPKASTLQRYADIFDISVYALETDNVNNEIALMHAFFALEDSRDMKLECDEKEAYFYLINDEENTSLFNHLSSWQKMKEKYDTDEITKEEYQKWKASYTEHE